MGKAKDEIEGIKSDELIKLERQLASAEEEAVKAKRKYRAEKMRGDELEAFVEDFKARRFDMPKQSKKRGPKSRKSYIRVAFGDTHGCSIDPKAWNAFLGDLEYLKPKEVVHLGDVLDCGGWLAAHHTMNYVAQTDYSYADEVTAGNQMFDQLQKVVPKADIHVIEGNHDLRVETTCLTMTQRHRADAELLINAFAPRKVLNLEKRNIHWWSRGECHHDCVQGGTIKLGKCYFTHPQNASKHHAARMAEGFGKNVVYGHTHRRDYFPAANAVGDEWAAWSPGCMCVKRKYWHHTENFKHTQGYHLQIVEPDGSFLGFNVPIINGESYLSGLYSQ